MFADVDRPDVRIEYVSWCLTVREVRLFTMTERTSSARNGLPRDN